MSQLQFLFPFLTVAILLAYAWMLFKSRLNARLVRRSAIVILAAGTALFMYGFAKEGYSENIITAFLRALSDSIKLFLYDCDYLEVVEAQKIPLYADLLILTFYAAMLTSLSAIIMLFGKRAMTFLVLHLKRKPFRHVFVGINARSEMVAKGIRDEEIAFIEFPEDSDDEQLSVKKVMKNVSAGGRVDSLVSSGNITLLRAKHRLVKRDSSTDVMEQMGLGKIRRLIDKDTAFYMLSEDCDRNLQEILILAGDKDLKDNTIHASVRREGLSGSYKLVLAKTGAHFIYPSSLSVVELMKNASSQPAALMTVDRDSAGKPCGTVSSEFNAQIIGFGETGQAALKFLYEFSSAIAPDGHEIPTNIYVSDERMESLKGHFMFSVPDMDHDRTILYENFGTDTGMFWKNLMERLDKLNYIVISMRDDGPNLDLACTIFTYAMKKRSKQFEDFHIFVRKRYTPEYERKLVERMNEKAGKEVITCFGEYEKIFTPEMIISRSSSGINANATTIAGRLEDEFRRISGTERISDDRPMSFSQKRRMRLEMHQFISSANHIPSKLRFTCGEREVSETVIENVAKAEHLRFKRYLLAHGYTYSEEDDDVLKTNHQICKWESLPETDRQYHRNIVKASLALQSSAS